MDDNLIRGDTNEIQCILDFQKRGYCCSIPFSSSCRYDVIVDINNKIYRIQCKSSTYKEKNGVLVMGGTRQTTNTSRTTVYKYLKKEIDYFYTSWNNYSFLIPVEEVSSIKYLRVKKPKNGILGTMCIASDYLLDNVINSIIDETPIKKYIDNRFISIQNGIEKIWNLDEFNNTFSQRQIRYIKERIMKDGIAYNMKWKYKEFPAL